MIYIDTSVILSKLFREPIKFKWSKLKGKKLLSCPLIYYEVMSSCRREQVDYKDAQFLLSTINILSPNALLEDEVQKVLKYGYLKGADLMHVATAIWISKNEPENLYFLSFDNSQSKVAKDLGFKVM